MGVVRPDESKVLEQLSDADIERYRRFVTWDHATLARMAAEVVGELIRIKENCPCDSGGPQALVPYKASTKPEPERWSR